MTSPRKSTFEQLDQRNLLSVNIELLADINEGEGSGVIPTIEAVQLGDHLYYAADDGFLGTELWRTDGTEAGTELVADIYAGEFSSQPTDLTVFQNEVYFAATDEDGDELWKTDGTDAGTMQVKDIWEGVGDSFPAYMIVLGDELFFSASDGVTGDELWKSDGTEAGTELVLDIAAGEFGSFPDFPYQFQNEIYFAATSDANSDSELWKTDGTAGGTVLVKDILAGADGSYPESFFEFNEELFFVASETPFDEDGFVQYGLFTTDGTDEGTIRVTNDRITFDLDNTPNIVEFDGALYYGGINDTVGWELFKTDGTPGNSQLVHDLAGAFESVPASFEILNGELFFAANAESGRELFKTDGANWDQLTETENTNPELNGILPANLIVFHDEILFTGNQGDGWQVFGTDGNTVEQLSNLNEGQFPAIPPVDVFFEFGDQLLFRAAEDDTGLEFWSISVTDQPDPDPILTGDIDGDGEVGFSDFLILSVNFKQTNATKADGDLDGDGQVQFSDFLILSTNFGNSLAQADSGAAAIKANLEIAETVDWLFAS